MISVLIGVQPLGDCQLSIKQLLMNQSRYKQTNKQFIYLFVLLWMWRSYSVSVCNKHWAVNYISQNTLCWTHFYFLCHSENSEFDPLHLKHLKLRRVAAVNRFTSTEVSRSSSESGSVGPGHFTYRKSSSGTGLSSRRLSAAVSSS